MGLGRNQPHHFFTFHSWNSRNHIIRKNKEGGIALPQKSKKNANAGSQKWEYRDESKDTHRMNDGAKSDQHKGIRHTTDYYKNKQQPADDTAQQEQPWDSKNRDSYTGDENHGNRTDSPYQAPGFSPDYNKGNEYSYAGSASRRKSYAEEQYEYEKRMHEKNRHRDTGETPAQPYKTGPAWDSPGYGQQKDTNAGKGYSSGHPGNGRGKGSQHQYNNEKPYGKKDAFPGNNQQKKIWIPSPDGGVLDPDQYSAGRYGQKETGQNRGWGHGSNKSYKKASGKDTDTSQPGKNYAGRQTGGFSTSHTGQQGGSVSRRSAFSEEQRDYEEKMHRKPTYDPNIPRPDGGILKPGKDKDGHSGKKGQSKGGGSGTGPSGTASFYNGPTRIAVKNGKATVVSRNILGVMGTKGRRIRVSHTMAMAGRSLARSVLFKLEQGTDTGEGLRKSVDILAPLALASAETARAILNIPGAYAISKETHMEMTRDTKERIKKLNRILSEHGVETFDPSDRYGRTWLLGKIKALKEKGNLTAAEKEILEAYQGLLKEDRNILRLSGIKAHDAKIREANQWLKRNGYQTIRAGGKNGAILAGRMAHRLKNKARLSKIPLSGKDKVAYNLYRMLCDEHKLAAFRKPVMKLRRVRMNAIQKMKRYLRLNETEAGRGLLFTMAIARGVSSLLRFVIRNSKHAVEMARIILKRGILTAKKRKVESLKKRADKALKKGDVGKAGRLSQKRDSIIKKQQAKSKKKAAKISKRKNWKIRRQNFFRRLYDPFDLRGKTRKFMKNLAARFRKTKAGSALWKVGRVLSKFGAVGKILGAIGAGVSAFFHAVMIILAVILAIIIIILLVMAVIEAAGGSFDLQSAEEKKLNAVISQIQECYMDDLEYIGELQSSGKYDSVSVSSVNYLNEAAYEQNMDVDEAKEEYTESTNFAEMMSMILNRFDKDFEGYSKRQIKKYTRELYYGTHSISVQERKTTNVASDGTTEERIDANVTYTTYYFDYMFEAPLLSSPNRTAYSMSASMFGTSVDDMYVYLRDCGYSLAGACGILGNAQAESGFNPESLSSSGYYGLFQWSASASRTLSAFCSNNGLDYTTASGQMAYLNATLNGTSVGYMSGFDRDILYGILTSTDDPQLAAEAFCVGYERAVGGSDVYHYWDQYNPYGSGASYKYQNLVGRVNYANDLYAKYSAYGDDYQQLATVYGSEKGREVIEEALKYVGNPYIWGGTSLTTGADCSGYIVSIYQKFGISLPHSSASLRSVGQAVPTNDMSQWQAGDIICYQGHVALYIGNSQARTITDTHGGTVTIQPYSIVHSSNSKPYPSGGIKISSNPNYKTIVAVRRVLQ